MFNKKEVSNPDVFDTLIGINSTFEGNIETNGTLRVDGKINGDLKVNGDVFIGKDAVVNGNIFAKNIHISGIVQGNVETKETLKVLSTAKLYGDICVNSLITEEGSIFEGKCKMTAGASNGEDTKKGDLKKNDAVKHKKTAKP